MAKPWLKNTGFKLFSDGEKMRKETVWKFFLLVSLVMLAKSLAFAEGTPVPAPIHPSSLALNVKIKGAWPVDKVKPTATGKALRLLWDGKSVESSRQGEYFPELFANIEIAVPTGAKLLNGAGHSIPTKEVEGVTDYVNAEVQIKLLQMDKGELPFKILLGNKAINFTIDYSLQLDDSVFLVHASCRDNGIFIQHVNDIKRIGFIFARCYVTENELRLNILKPIDRTFILKQGSKVVLTAENDQPVIKIKLPNDKRIKTAKIAEIRLENDVNDAQIYEMYYEK